MVFREKAIKTYDSSSMAISLRLKRLKGNFT